MTIYLTGEEIERLTKSNSQGFKMGDVFIPIHQFKFTSYKIIIFSKVYQIFVKKKQKTKNVILLIIFIIIK